jgi:hypothetical protein
MTATAIMIMPGFPGEMPYYTRGLDLQGARVLGLADHPYDNLPPLAKRHLADFKQVPNLFTDEAAAIAAVREWTRGQTIDRISCLWEPGVILAGALRDALGVPGQTREQAVRFRDKQAMKEAVVAAGVRAPYSHRARTVTEVWEGAEQVGYPLIIKPIAGAGSQDTYRCNEPSELTAALARLGHIEEVSVEEFIEADEYTFDTICIDGEIRYFHIGFYRPRPLIARSVEWISPQTLSYRAVDDPRLAGGRAMGEAVLRALDRGTGFSHMEWYLKADGEAVFGEIAARPPGAHTVDLMNFQSDIDLFVGWAEAELKGTFSLEFERKYNCANITKRAQGQGRIRAIEGMDKVHWRCGAGLVAVDLLPVGAERRNWKHTLLSDGFLIIRHPEWQETMDMADYIGTELQLYAG